mgnify:FL=1
MKKILSKIVTLVLACSLFFTVFTGCSLITTVQDKDMAQVVAKVKIEDDVDAVNIYKRDVVSAFNSYGYYYVTNYNYTVQQALDYCAKTLVQNQVVIQYAKIELAKRYTELKADSSKVSTDYDNALLSVTANGTLTAKSSADDFLTEYELSYALYQVKKNITSIIDSYKDKDKKEETEYEKVSITARTTPSKEEEDRTSLSEKEMKETTPTQEEYEVAALTLKKEVDELKTEYTTLYALNKAVYDTYNFEISDKESKKALNEAITNLKNSGIIPSNETYAIEDVLKYTYFKNALKNQKESLIVSKYEDYLNDDIERNLDKNALYDDYKSMYSWQKGTYQGSLSDYETALDKVSDKSFVVYNPLAGYGYVSHVLLPYSEEIKSAITAKEGEKNITKEEIDAYKEEMLGRITVNDQRKTWIQNNYGTYDETTGKFTFEDKYLYSVDVTDETLKTNALNALSAYNGTLLGADSREEEQDNGLKKTLWSFDSIMPTTYAFKDFYQTYFTDLLGMNAVYYKEDDASSINKLTYSEDYYKVFKDVMFAFSDSNAGGFDTTYGFVYSPSSSGTKYVKNFANAARDLVSQGAGAYTIVPTEYGYHVMVCTKAITDLDDRYVNDKALFESELSVEGSTAYLFRKVKLEAITSSEVNVRASSFINGYMDKITISSKVYSDLAK